MLRVALPVLFALALISCGKSPAPEPGAAKPVAAETAAPAPVATPAAAPVPEGTCGDQSAVAAEQRIHNSIKWSTASEQDNFGYDVFRGDKEDGPFIKLTKDPMLGAGTSDETHKYEFKDDTIDPCMEYWYYVESISNGGVREKFTPTFKAKAKRVAKADAAH